MSIYTIVLFLHVSGAIGYFVIIGIWLFGLVSLRRAQRVECIRQRSDYAHAQTIDDACFGRILRWQQQTRETEASGGDRNRQDASDGIDAAVERQLAEHERVLKGLRRELSRRCQDAECDRQIE